MLKIWNVSDSIAHLPKNAAAIFEKGTKNDGCLVEGKINKR
ncbi:hypothetical protein HMPREF0511_1534 [Limosilactobacillus fermentum ATCC 14931]|nr:hypothetical protein HMPREF0511_1534 [Limosilactobacillus fermentum ATCC 14931]